MLLLVRKRRIFTLISLNIILIKMAIADFDIVDKKERYLATIKQLRLKNFSKNLPFLILSDKLPDGQVYREFPDGRIEVQAISSIGSKYNSTVIQILKPAEANRIREEHGLL